MIRISEISLTYFRIVKEYAINAKTDGYKEIHTFFQRPRGAIRVGRGEQQVVVGSSSSSAVALRHRYRTRHKQ